MTAAAQYTWEGVLAVEGEGSVDGREIAPGALRWPTLPIPLRDLAGEVIGRVDSIWRDGNLIRGKGVTFRPIPEVPLGAEVKVERWAVADEAAVWRGDPGAKMLVSLDQGVLGGMAVVQEPAFPQARLEPTW